MIDTCLDVRTTRHTHLDVPRHARRCHRLPELVPPLRVEAMPVPRERHLLGAERLAACHLHLRRKVREAREERHGTIRHGTAQHVAGFGIRRIARPLLVDFVDSLRNPPHMREGEGAGKGPTTSKQSTAEAAAAVVVVAAAAASLLRPKKERPPPLAAASPIYNPLIRKNGSIHHPKSRTNLSQHTAASAAAAAAKPTFHPIKKHEMHAPGRTRRPREWDALSGHALTAAQGMYFYTTFRPPFGRCQETKDTKRRAPGRKSRRHRPPRRSCCPSPAGTPP